MAMVREVYLVTKDIARRSGLIQERYRIADGRFVEDDKDLSRIRLLPDEYIHGLDGIERVDEDVAQRLIAENGYQMGEETEQVTTQETNTETNDNDQQETVETENETVDEGGSTETIGNEDVGSVEDVLGDLVNGGDSNEQENNETTEE